jgi:hypothetical protein
MVCIGAAVVVCVGMALSALAVSAEPPRDGVP